MPESAPACDLCQSERSAVRPEKTQILRLPPPIAVCQCLDCGLLRLNPRHTTDELAALYAADPFWSPENIAQFPDRRRFEQSRWRRVERWMPQRGSLVGMACLEGGHTLANASRRGWNVVGVEFIENLVQFAAGELHVEMVRTPFWDLDPLVGRSFDAAYTHSLEHVPYPRKTLRDFHRLLRPGGLLVMEVPNQFHSLKDVIRQAIFDLWGRRVLQHLAAVVGNAFHLYYFDPPTLRRILDEEGFEIVSFRTYLPWHPVYLYNRRARLLQELTYIAGAAVERGPCMEVIARKRSGAGAAGA